MELFSSDYGSGGGGKLTLERKRRLRTFLLKSRTVRRQSWYVGLAVGLNLILSTELKIFVQ